MVVPRIGTDRTDSAVRRLAVVLLLAALGPAGCDSCVRLGGPDDIIDGEASDSARDVPVDVRGDAPDRGPDAEVDAADHAEASDDGDAALDAWPDVPDSCTWFEPQTAWTCAPAERYRRDPFLAPGDGPLLRMISMYEAPRGAVTVRLMRTYRPVVLVFSAYESTTWTIEREPGAELARVLTYGYEPQIVAGADDVPVEDRTAAVGRSYAGCCWPFCRDGDPREVVADAEAATGLTLATFDGCYDSGLIVLGDVCREECLPETACSGRECGYVGGCGFECGACDAGEICTGDLCVSCSPRCEGHVCGPDGCGGSCGICEGGTACGPDGTCVVPTAFPGCEAVASESHYCLTLLDAGGIALLGLDSGTICPLGKAEDLFVSLHGYVHSTAWLDGYLYLCIDHPSIHGILRFSLLDDTYSTAPYLCESVATWRTGLVVQAMWPEGLMEGLVHFTTFEDAMDGVGEELGWSPRGGRMVARGDLLYDAWHSTNEVDVHSLPDGGLVRTILLEGYDDWIWGMSVTDDGLLVVTNGRAGGVVASFDEATGAARGRVTVSETIAGLNCFARP